MAKKEDLRAHFDRLTPRGMGAAIAVHVVPRAHSDEVAGYLPDGRLKVRVTSPPSGGAANRAVVALLAQVLQVREGAIEIVVGASGRDKILSVMNLDPATVEARLGIWLERPKARPGRGGPR